MDRRHGNAIRFCAVSLGYPGRTVIKDFDAIVPRSGMTALLGQNGCGKTTVLRSLIKHTVLVKGAIYINGRNMKHMGVEALPQYVSYAPAGLDDVMGFRVIDLVLNARRNDAWMSETEALDALGSVGIRDLSERMYNELSTGQRRLALIARSLAIDAPIALLDEPTSGLDPTNRKVVLDVIRKLAGRKRAVLVATHDIDLALRSDYVIALKNGRLLGSGRSDKILGSKMLTELYDSMIYVGRSGGRRFAVLGKRN